MKKLIIILVAILPLQILAQVRFGISGGINFSSMSFGKYKPERTALAGLNAGTTFQIPFGEAWAIITGPYYSAKGVVHGKSSMTGKVDSFTTRLNYIELPLMVGYAFLTENNGLLALSAGPYLSYGFNGKETVRASDNDPSLHLHKKTSQFKRLDAGLMTSLQYEWKGNYGIRLDVSKSLFNISRDKDYKQRNFVIGASLFWYIFPKRFKGPGGTPRF
jgi:Outer membrane protein beta-barrel domain